MQSPDTPQADFARDVVRRLRDAGFEALWAGGCVRDLVLGLSPKDYDVATTATPEQVRELFGNRRTIPVGLSFGVVLVLGPKGAGQIEVATFRREGEYLDGRRPERVEYCTPEEDAHRRDFTINGMFYDPLAETVLDYVGGREDLARGVIRCIGNPLDRFHEDKLRMLRAVRFTARFGFTLDEATAAAIRDHASGLLIVSVERITQELRQMWAHPQRRRGVELTIELGLWRIILPELPLELPADAETELTLGVIQEIRPPSADLVLSVLCRALPPDDVHALCRKLRVSNEQRERVAWLVEHQDALRNPERLALSRLKPLLASPHAELLLEWTRARQQVREGTTSDFEFCDRYRRETPADRIDPPPLLSGDDLVRAGMNPGKEFKRLLDEIRTAQLEETIHSREQALEMIARLRQSGNEDKK